MQLQKRRLQIAADAAALGAAYEMALGKSDWAAAARSDAGLNGFTNGSNAVTVTVQNPPSSGSYAGDSSAIQVIVSKNVPTFLWGFLASSSTVTASAVSSGKPGGDCLYALNSSLSRALMLSGTINASCPVFDNSSNSDALHLDGGSSMTAASIDIVGSYTNSGTLHSTPVTGVAAITDPISTAAPSFSSCNYTNAKMDSSTGSKTFSPGTYCGGITLSGSYTATFQPGLYIVTGGINWNGGSIVNGSGVSFYFTTGGGSSYGQVVISGGVTVTLSAPLDSSAGGIPGILMWRPQLEQYLSKRQFQRRQCFEDGRRSLLPNHWVYPFNGHPVGGHW